MKNYNFLILILFFSCEQKVETGSNVNSANSNTTIPLKIPKEEDSILTAWSQYYQKENSNFKSELFQLKETFPISYRESSVDILHQKGFNEIYKPFLVFNESRDHYLDFDSYNWFIDPNGNAGYEADQQVVVVDLEKKSAKQIAFFGPSFWVEDAYWKSDSVVVLLGNSYEKIPFKMEFNFKTNKAKNYIYPDTLKFETPYSKIRLRSKGIKVE